MAQWPNSVTVRLWEALTLVVMTYLELDILYNGCLTHQRIFDTMIGMTGRVRSHGPRTWTIERGQAARTADSLPAVAGAIALQYSIPILQPLRAGG
jgi:hypothetical protein